MDAPPAIAIFAYRGFRRRRASAAEFAELKESAREDLVALADDVQELEHRVDADPDAKRDYLAALDQYSQGSASFGGDF